MKKCDCRAYVIAGLMLATFATAVQAQYVWVDERGRKQFSDMPPPASVPAHRILKQPGVPAERPMAGDAAGGEPETRAPTPPAQQAEAPPTLAERDAEFRRRRAEQAEKEQKAAEEARRLAENRKRCERLRDFQRALVDGERIARRDASGERVVLDDRERERELQETRRALQECK